MYGVTPEGGTTTVSGAIDHGGLGGGVGSSGTLQHLKLLIEYRIDREYWLMKNRNVYPATRRNFLRLYSEVRPQLETFMRENNINFRDEQHLRSLTMFANSLLITEPSR
jgi:hypothetical protein